MQKSKLIQHSSDFSLIKCDKNPHGKAALLLVFRAHVSFSLVSLTLASFLGIDFLFFSSLSN